MPAAESMKPTTSQVWTLLHDDLAGYFRRRVPDEHLAEDLVQDTFVRVHDHLSDVLDGDRLAAWVRRIARNVLMDHHRRRGTVSTTDPDGEPLESAPAPAAEEESLTSLAGGWARAMIRQLPPGYREALELSEIDGLPQEQIAARLDLTPSGAKSRIQRGRARLRDLLLACCHVEFDGHGNVVDYVRGERCEGCSDC